MIARLTAQKIHLDDAITRIAAVPGQVLEVGLGKGRTYNHLRTKLPDREILVFDGSLHAPSDVHPPKHLLALGNFIETLPAAVNAQISAALIHADIGSDDRSYDARLADSIAPVLAQLLATNGLLLCDRPLVTPTLVAIESPATPWPYFRYRSARQ